MIFVSDILNLAYEGITVSIGHINENDECVCDVPPCIPSEIPKEYHNAIVLHIQGAGEEEPVDNIYMQIAWQGDKPRIPFDVHPISLITFLKRTVPCENVKIWNLETMEWLKEGAVPDVISELEEEGADGYFVDNFFCDWNEQYVSIGVWKYDMWDR